MGAFADHSLMVFTVLFLYPGTGVSYGMARTTCKRTAKMPSERIQRTQTAAGCGEDPTCTKIQLLRFTDLLVVTGTFSTH